MEMHGEIAVFGLPVEMEALRQIENAARDEHVMQCALMADHHVGYAVPIGGVIAYEDAISPSGVGFDIACGNKAVRLDIPVADVKHHIREIMDKIWMNIAFGMGRTNRGSVDHELFDDNAWTHPGVAPLKEIVITWQLRFSSSFIMSVATCSDVRPQTSRMRL